MKIDATRVCREALEQQPADRDLGTALVFAANRIYRKRSAEIGLAVLKLIEQYAGRFEKTRLEVLKELAEGKVTIERSTTRFPMKSSFPPQGDSGQPTADGPAPGACNCSARYLASMRYRLLGRAAVREK
jgi:hypothetical protein